MAGKVFRRLRHLTSSRTPQRLVYTMLNNWGITLEMVRASNASCFIFSRPKVLQEAVQLANVATNPREPSSEFPSHEEPLLSR